MFEQTHQAKKDFSRIGLSLLVIAIVSTVLQLLLAWIWQAFLRDTPLGDADWMVWLLTFAPLYLAAMPLGLLVMRKVPVQPQSATKMGAKRFWLLMLMCMPIMYGGNIIGNLLSNILSGGTAENALESYIMSSRLYTLIVAVLIAPILEEYIFRKQIIDRLSKYGEETAIIFSALAFGLFHMNLFQFFYAFGLGLIFAYVYTRTRRLRYSVFMHMIINFLGSVVAPWLLSSVDTNLINAMAAGEATTVEIIGMLPILLLYLVYSYGLLACVIIGIIMLCTHWKQRILIPSEQELPYGTAVRTAYLNTGMVLFCGFCLIMILFSLISGLL